MISFFLSFVVITRENCTVMDMDNYLKISSKVIYYSNYIFSPSLTIPMMYIAWTNIHHFPLTEYETPLIYFVLLNFIMVVMECIVLDDIRFYNGYKYLDKNDLMKNSCVTQTVVYYICCLHWLLIVTYYLMYREKPVLLLWVFSLLFLSTVLGHFRIYNLYSFFLP